VSEELIDYQVVRALQKRVADLQMADRRERAARGEPERSSADEQQQAQSIIRQVVSWHMQQRLGSGEELPDSSYDARLRAAVFAAIYGAGELQELLEDPLVENIDINGFDEVWVSYAGDERWPRRWRPVAASDEHLISIVANLGSYAGMNARPFSTSTPTLDVRLQDGSRLSAVMVASERPSVSIRRNRYPQMFLRPDMAEKATPPGKELLPDLVSLGTVTPEVADFLYRIVRGRQNIIIGGSTDSGKTTMLRSLVNCIDRRERLVTVEIALELGLDRHPELHDNVVALEVVLPDAEGKGGLDIATLVRRTRRMNPQRVIVGEVLGPEVVEMLSAMAQGNDGSLSTIHARDADEVFNRISTYAQQFENMTAEVAHASIAGAIDFVVFMEKNPLLGGRRCVTQVVEISGMQSGRVSRNNLFVPSPIDGRAVRDPEVALTPRRAARLAAVESIEQGGVDDAPAAMPGTRTPDGW
jgi:Flp pilus assembly CpaF family ATPase